MGVAVDWQCAGKLGKCGGEEGLTNSILWG
jgi:hypothetical protein